MDVHIDAIAAINAILKQLEEVTGLIVDDVSLVSYDATSLSDEKRQMKRTVAIEMVSPSNVEWYTK